MDAEGIAALRNALRATQCAATDPNPRRAADADAGTGQRRRIAGRSKKYYGHRPQLDACRCMRTVLHCIVDGQTLLRAPQARTR